MYPALSLHLSPALSWAEDGISAVILQQNGLEALYLIKEEETPKARLDWPFFSILRFPKTDLLWTTRRWFSVGVQENVEGCCWTRISDQMCLFHQINLLRLNTVGQKISLSNHISMFINTTGSSDHLYESPDHCCAVMSDDTCRPSLTRHDSCCSLTPCC